MKSTPLAADYHPVEVLWEDDDLIAGEGIQGFLVEGSAFMCEMKVSLRRRSGRRTQGCGVYLPL